MKRAKQRQFQWNKRLQKERQCQAETNRLKPKEEEILKTSIFTKLSETLLFFISNKYSYLSEMISSTRRTHMSTISELIWICQQVNEQMILAFCAFSYPCDFERRWRPLSDRKLVHKHLTASFVIFPQEEIPREVDLLGSTPCEQWCDQTATFSHWTSFHHVNSDVTRPPPYTEPHFTMWTVVWPDQHVLTLNHISPCEQWCDQTTSHWTTFHHVNSDLSQTTTSHWTTFHHVNSDVTRPPSHTEPHFTMWTVI